MEKGKKQGSSKVAQKAVTSAKRGPSTDGEPSKRKSKSKDRMDTTSKSPDQKLTKQTKNSVASQKPAKRQGSSSKGKG